MTTQQPGQLTDLRLYEEFTRISLFSSVKTKIAKQMFCVNASIADPDDFFYRIRKLRSGSATLL
jgi:hypothetical protein